MHNFSISLDGFAAGPDQAVEHPLGVGRERLPEWVFPEGGKRTASTRRSSPGERTASAPRSWSKDLRPPAGGTTFHFVTDGIEAALDRARAAAGGEQVRLGGGERLLDDRWNSQDRWTCVEFAPSAAVAHVRLRRRGPGVFDTMGA